MPKKKRTRRPGTYEMCSLLLKERNFVFLLAFTAAGVVLRPGAYEVCSLFLKERTFVF